MSFSTKGTESERPDSSAGIIEHPIDHISDLIWSAHSNVIQVETLPHYGVPDDDRLFGLWKRGEKFNESDLIGYNSWFSRVKSAVQNGVDVNRIHVVPDNLTEYLKFEIEVAYLGFCVPSGERVGIVKQSDHLQLARSIRGDFYLLDHNDPNCRLILPQYDHENRFVRLLEVTDKSIIEEHKKLRGEVLACAVPVNEFYSGYSDRH